jgi:hypothetical protein
MSNPSRLTKLWGPASRKVVRKTVANVVQRNCQQCEHFLPPNNCAAFWSLPAPYCRDTERLCGMAAREFSQSTE